MAWTGLPTACRKCGTVYERTREHFPRADEYSCRLCLNAAKLAWCKANPEQRKAIQDRHAPKARARLKAKYQPKPRRVPAFASSSERARAWRLAKPDLAAWHSRQWAIRNPEAARASVRNFKNIARGVVGKLTGQQLRDRYEEQSGRCAYCLLPLDGRYDIEHVIPISRGGSNGIDNVVCACRSCNIEKGNKTVLEFLQYREVKSLGRLTELRNSRRRSARCRS